MDSRLISLVIPVYNEEATLPELRTRVTRLLARIDHPVEVILVDDGSSDKSLELMRGIHKADPRFRVLSFSRNFGHQAALSAGCDHARGAAVITMDADLQDPPEVIEAMITAWKKGADIVHGVRNNRTTDSWFKRSTALFFYHLLNRFASIKTPVNSADFRLLDQHALQAFLSLREKNRYIRGLVSWIGFKQEYVYYERAERFAGETKYPFTKMLYLAIDALISFSNVPIRLCTMLGFGMAALACVIGLWFLIHKLVGNAAYVTGWTSLVVLICFIGGIQILMIGVIGEYVSRVVDEVRDRPLYLVHHKIGFENSLEVENLPR